MKELDFSRIDAATRAAMLDFLNRAPDATYLSSEKYLRDDPSTGYGDQVRDYGIGKTVAERIIDMRDRQPGGDFASLDLLNEVAYFGQDKLDDLAFTLGNATLHRNRAELFVDGPECLDVLLDTIGSARNYLHLSSFLFFNDEIGQEVADALVDRAANGVEVRVMLDRKASEHPDGSGHPTRHDIGALLDRLRNGQVQVTDMQPIEEGLTPAQLDALRDAGVPDAWVDEQEEINRLWLLDINHVDHRKMVVADGKVALVMSHGIGNEYLYRDTSGPGEGPPRWHDASTRITGGAAVPVNHQFAKRWFLSGGDVFDHEDPFFSPDPVPAGSDTVWFLECKPGDVLDSVFIALLGLEEDFARQANPLRNFFGRDLLLPARTEVFVQNPYVLDDEIFDSWVKLLGRRPVGLKLFRPHPDVNDYPGSNLPAARDYVRWLFRRNDLRLLKAGGGVFEYLPAFNHLKVALVDDWFATHGSYNLNYRSAKKDLEFNVFVESKSYAQQMRSKIFDVDAQEVNTIGEADAREAADNPVQLTGTLPEAIIRQIG